MDSKIIEIITNTVTDNDLFTRRLAEYPIALEMSFWEPHFELHAVSLYPEISGNILDFGCGTGHLDIILARNGNVIHGIDINDTAINIANYLKSLESLETQTRISFTKHDILDTPLKKFDSLWSTHVFEHINDPSSILDSFRNWLVEDAHVLISVPIGNFYDDEDHIHHFYNQSQLLNHLQPHINVVRIDEDIKNHTFRALCKI